MQHNEKSPVRGFIKALLEVTAAEHHEYEQKELHGANDAEWAEWYAMRIAGKLARDHAPVWDMIHDYIMTEDARKRDERRGHSDKFDK